MEKRSAISKIMIELCKHYDKFCFYVADQAYPMSMDIVIITDHKCGLDQAELECHLKKALGPQYYDCLYTILGMTESEFQDFTMISFRKV